MDYYTTLNTQSPLYTGPINIEENGHYIIKFGIVKYGEILQEFIAQVALDTQTGKLTVKSNGQEVMQEDEMYYSISENEAAMIELIADEGVTIQYTIYSEEKLYTTPFIITEGSYITAKLYRGDKQIGSKVIYVYVTPSSSMLMMQPAVVDGALETKAPVTVQIIEDKVILTFEPSVEITSLEALQINDIQLTSADVANVVIENGELIFTVSPEVAQQLQLATEITVDATYLDAKAIRQTFYTEFLQLVE